MIKCKRSASQEQKHGRSIMKIDASSTAHNTELQISHSICTETEASSNLRQDKSRYRTKTEGTMWIERNSNDTTKDSGNKL